jgi:AcrR family transcriptional regulator
MTATVTRQGRKKRRTRALIQETAWELFAAHGYDATTIKAIADAADVAPRTVTMHFPAKDDLLFADEDHFAAERLEQRLATRPAGQPALETVRQWMTDTIAEVDSDPAGNAEYWRGRALRARLIADNDRLRGLARASYATAERVLAAAVAADLHLEAEALAPALTATIVVTGLRELYDSHEARALGPEPSGSELVQLVNQVIDYAAAGLAAITG